MNLIELYNIKLNLHSFDGDTTEITNSIISIEYEESFGSSSDRLTILFDDKDLDKYNFFEQGDSISLWIGNEKPIGSGKMQVAQMSGSFAPNTYEIDAVSKYTVENTMETVVSVSANNSGKSLYNILRNASITAGFDTVVIDDEFKNITIKNVVHRRIKIKNLIKDYIDKFGGFIKIANFTRPDGTEKKHIYIHKKKFFLIDQITGEDKPPTHYIARHKDEYTQNHFYTSKRKDSSEILILNGFDAFNWEILSIEINEFENDYTDPRTGKRYVSKKKTVYKSGTRIKKAQRVESDNESKSLSEAFEDKQENINISFTYVGESYIIRAGETILLNNFLPTIDERRFLVTSVSHSVTSTEGWIIEVKATNLE